MKIRNKKLFFGLIIFFMALGLILIIIATPLSIKPLLSKEVFEYMFQDTSQQENVYLSLIGILILVVSVLIGLLLGITSSFNSRITIPNNIDVMKAQNQAIYLVDGRVFHKIDALFYNLEDRNNIRLLTHINLFRMDLYNEIIISSQPSSDKPQLKENGIKTFK